MAVVNQPTRIANRMSIADHDLRPGIVIRYRSEELSAPFPECGATAVRAALAWEGKSRCLWSDERSGRIRNLNGGPAAHKPATPKLCLSRVAVLDAHMSKSQSNAGTIEVDGATYDWRLHREPHLSDDEGWKGMTISLLQRDAKREALLEFPAPKRLLKGLPRGRLQLDEATISRCVRSAMSAGWEPMSRGKPVLFSVDADGN